MYSSSFSCILQGLSDLFFEDQPSMTLVSNGAECISIHKKLFEDYASHAFMTRIRGDVSLILMIKAAFHPYVNNLCFVVNLVLSLSVLL